MEDKDRKWALPFFSILAAQQLSIIGSMLGGFALVWWVADQFDSATMLAMMTLVQMLPGIILGPFIGALVDRWDRRKVMIISDSLVALFSLVLAILFWTDTLQLWHVFVVMVIRAIGGTFHWPAMAASTSLMVPKDQLSRVAGINQTLIGIWNIVAPPAGALLMTVLPLYAIMMIDVVTAIFAIIPLFFITIPQPKRVQKQDHEDSANVGSMVRSVLRDVKEGLRYAWNWPGLRAIMIIATLINLVLNPAFSLLPLLVKNYFGKGALELGWIESAFGFGFVAGGLLLSVWGGFKRKIVTSMLGLIGMGLGCVALGLVPAQAFTLAIGAAFLLGITNTITNVPIHAMMQSVVEPAMQGRVLTTLSSVAAGMSPLGMAVAGPLSDRFGVQIWFVFGGVVCILMAVIALLSPAVLTVEEQKNGGVTHAETVAVGLEPT